MTIGTPTQHKAKYPKLKLLWIFPAALIIAAAVFISLLPAMIGFALERHLHQSNMAKTYIKNIDLNLFKGHMSIETFDAISNESENIRANKVEVDFALRPLLKNTVHIKNIQIDGLHVQAIQQDDGSITIGYHEAANTESSPIIENTKPQLWTIQLDNLMLSNTALELYNAKGNASFGITFNAQLQDLAADTVGKLYYKQFSINDCAFIANSQTRMQFKSLAIKQLNFDKQLTIDAITLDSLTMNILREKNGELFSQNIAKQFSLENLSPKNTETTDADKPVHWSIKSFTLGGDSSFSLNDLSVIPEINTGFKIKTFTVGAINSGQPTGKTPLALELARDDYDSIKLTGTIAPLQKNLFADLKLDIKNFDISHFSPYAVNFIGYKVQTGQLNLNNTVSLDARNIKSSNKVILHNFTVAVGDEAKAEAFESEISMSLDSALYFIRDDHGDVALEIPIEGSLDDPAFNLGPIIRQASAKALQGTTITYLKFALLPWGALYMIGEQISNAIGNVQLEPVYFTPADVSLNEDMSKYLNKIAELLHKKEKLRLTLCPISNIADSEQLQKTLQLSAQNQASPELLKQLYELSRQRAEAIKIYLVTQHKLDPGRLFKCASNHTDAENTKPQVSLSF